MNVLMRQRARERCQGMYLTDVITDRTCPVLPLINRPDFLREHTLTHTHAAQTAPCFANPLITTEQREHLAA